MLKINVILNNNAKYFYKYNKLKRSGILELSMPIVIESVSLEKFLTWLEEE